jgi:hypothetical protein
MKREKTQISKIRSEKWAITTNMKVNQGIIRDYCKKLYSNKLENLEERDNFWILMTIQSSTKMILTT